MGIAIRLEQPGDYRETELVTREAFWDVCKPGCKEHFIVHNIRQAPVFVSELDYVAIDDNRIVGNIIYSKAKVVNENNQEFQLLRMGPLSVLPSYQRRGIGSKLIRHTIISAKMYGFKAIVVSGNPSYFNRFGFVNADKYNIKKSNGDNSVALMAMEICENGLKGINGKYFEDPVFDVDNDEFEEYEKGFPRKEK